MLRRVIALILSFAILFIILSVSTMASDDIINGENEGNIGAENTPVDNVNLDLDVKSAVLMEAQTGEILYSQNMNERLSPASVTKIMTLLLVAEAIANNVISLDDKVVVSSNASSMGGSQVFIEEGEEFSVEELLKCTIIASANDAAVALAELIAGNESSFVTRMNERAAAIGMTNTRFENCTGLDDTTTDHLTSAYDIAVMSRELIKHEIILKYSNVWQDTIRNGEFTLTNTNRLVRFYSGCTGLKTGSTDKAGYCVSTTAKRDGMHLIAVVMGAPTRDSRNNSARTMLDYGFSSYSLYSLGNELLETVDVKRSISRYCDLYSLPFSKLISKADIKKIEVLYNIPESITAPLNKGDVVGDITFMLEGNIIGKTDIIINEKLDEASILSLIAYLFTKLVK